MAEIEDILTGLVKIIREREHDHLAEPDRKASNLAAIMEAGEQIHQQQWERVKKLDWMQLVVDFHTKFGVHTEPFPTIPGKSIVGLRGKLHNEEFKELEEAIENCNLIEIADALGDILYVIIGSAISFGIDLRPVFDTIHASNMAKVGGGMRGDGKVLKPKGWQPPDIKGALKNQAALKELEAEDA